LTENDHSENADSSNLIERLANKGVTRRDFIKFAGLLTATLALPATYTRQVTRALLTAIRPPVVWMEFQDCTADSESFLRANNPGVDDLLLEIISLDYHETLMAPVGAMAEKSLMDTVANYPGQYIAIVEGSIPTANNGIHCTINGKSALSRAQTVCSNALATIAVGSCAWDGGLAAALPNPTGAKGVKDAVPGLATLINLPGCPCNVVNLLAVITHYLTFKQWPSTDAQGRPTSIYGETVHDECPREDHYEEGRFVLAWGDAGHRQGWCLCKMGCKGPETQNNCPSVKWNDGTCWPVQAGHGCLGCAHPGFWDQMSPFYNSLSCQDD
jgi:hydrogenase small subunit